jgi:hypothetical protein
MTSSGARFEPEGAGDTRLDRFVAIRICPVNSRETLMR